MIQKLHIWQVFDPERGFFFAGVKIKGRNRHGWHIYQSNSGKQFIIIEEV